MRIRNAERHLAQAIDSVLNQTFADFELLAVIGNSTDRSDEILAGYDDPRIRIVRPGVPGIIPAARAGLEAARGAYVAVLDADDIAAPDRFAVQGALLDADPGLVLVGSAIRIIDETGAAVGLRRYPTSDRAIRRDIVAYNVIAHSAAMYRREAARAAGGYIDDHVIEDYSLWFRLLRLGRAANVDRPLASYRIRTHEPAKHVMLMIRETRAVRAAAFARYGYARTLRSRAADLAFLALSLAPPLAVNAAFRAAAFRNPQRTTCT